MELGHASSQRRQPPAELARPPIHDPWSRALSRAVLWTAPAIMASVLFPRPALAYRTFADDPTIHVAAAQPDATVTVDLAVDGPEDQIGVFELALIAALDTWSRIDCSNLSLRYGGRTTAHAARGDGRNTVELVLADWEARGLPSGRGASTDVQLRELGPNAEIVEADVYVNLADYVFDEIGNGTALDRQAVLTHELGHVLGLLHPCEDAQPPAPDCRSVPSARESAMFPEYLGTRARHLSPDDEAGVCALYAAIGCPLSCGLERECRNDACATCATPDCAPVCPGSRCLDRTCGSGSRCLEGVCASIGTNAGRCVAPGELGASCAAGTDCRSDLCLVRDDQSYCTVACDFGTQCADGEACVAISGRNVCAPPPAARACTISVERTPAPRCALLTLLVFFALRRRRRRHIARSRRTTPAAGAPT